MDDSPSSSPKTRKKLISKYNELFDRENFEYLTITHEDNSIIKFLDLYQVIDVVGSGSFGLVVTALEKSTNEIYAMKVFLSDNSKKYFRNTKRENGGFVDEKFIS